MLKFLGSRFLQAIVTLFFIVTASFFLQRIAPGGPFDLERDVPDSVRVRLEREWGLDRPLLAQYGAYLRGIASFPPDLKRSITRPEYQVMELIAPRLRVSLSLALVVLLFSLAVGIPLGVAAGLHRNGAVDHGAMILALIGISVPNFVIGPALKWVFALELGWLPESRWVGPASLVLPTLALSAVYIATIARLIRAALIEVLDEDWIRTARAKGLSEARVVWRHALPAALVPLVAWLGPAMAGLAVGSVVIERVFSIPGLGNTFVEAAFNRDYTLVMGTVIVYSVILIAMNVVADLLLGFVDPRVRVGA